MPQEPRTPPADARRSVADASIRHLIESEHLAPPRIDAGLEVGAGDGALVLLLRKQDGTLTARRVERGPGDHGAAPAIATIDTPPEQPEVPDDQPAAQGAAAVAAAEPARIVLRRTGDAVSLVSAAGDLDAASFDREHLRPLLEQLFATTKGTRAEARVVIRAERGVLAQDVLMVWEVALAGGFAVPLFDDGAGRPAAREAQTLIAGLAQQFGWAGRKVEGLPMQLYDAEVLILLDGPVPFAEVAGWLRAAALAGIWRIGFVGQDGAHARCKLPTNLAFGG